MVPVSLRSACDMRRACRPMCESPISPSISALGTSAATESMTMTSMAPLRTRSRRSPGLLAVVRLGDEQVIGLDAEFSGVARVQRMLGIDEGGDAAALLGFGDDVQRQGRLAGGFRAVDLDDAAAWHAADAERDSSRASRWRWSARL